VFRIHFGEFPIFLHFEFACVRFCVGVGGLAELVRRSLLTAYRVAMGKALDTRGEGVGKKGEGWGCRMYPFTLHIHSPLSHKHDSNNFSLASECKQELNPGHAVYLDRTPSQTVSGQLAYASVYEFYLSVHPYYR